MSTDTPKVLLFDIETSPNVVYAWAVGYKINLDHTCIIKEREVICISYKWLHEKKVHTLTWDSSKKEDKDKQLLKKFKKIYDSADSVVAHNGKNFDIKWINTRLLHHRLGPLAPTNVCDTLLEARRVFRFNSNRLDYIAKFIGSQGKDKIGWDCWVKVMEGNKEALKKMSKYCERDILEMEEVYKELQPYINTLSSHAVTGNKEACPSCSSASTQKYGKYHTKTGKYQKHKCSSCGHVWKDGRMLKQ